MFTKTGDAKNFIMIVNIVKFTNRWISKVYLWKSKIKQHAIIVWLSNVDPKVYSYLIKLLWDTNLFIFMVIIICLKENVKVSE